MLRRIALSILILLSVVAILPVADSAAHGLRQSVSMQRRHHRHSRRWWRRHRARMRQRQAAMAHRRTTLALPTDAALPASTNDSPGSNVLPQAPSGWNAVPAGRNGELKFRTNEDASAQAALSVVALTRPAPAYLTSNEQRQILGGVSFS